MVHQRRGLGPILAIWAVLFLVLQPIFLVFVLLFK
jgi:hypothetical protein